MTSTSFDNHSINMGYRRAWPILIKPNGVHIIVVVHRSKMTVVHNTEHCYVVTYLDLEAVVAMDV